MQCPLFFHSTTIVCVDDDKLFSKTVSEFLKKKHTVLTFDSGEEVVDYFKNYQPLLTPNQFFSTDNAADHYSLLNHLPTDLNLGILAELKNNPARLDEIPIIITDYSMQAINGIELCRKLQHLPMKKILLTGIADSSLAVKAFNEGVIDCFINKDHPDLVNQLNFYLQKLLEKYFVEKTKNLLDYLEIDSPLHFSDPVFVSFFKSLCEEHQIIEYFLIDKMGNFVLQDKYDKSHYLILHTQKSLNNLLDLYESDDSAKIFINEIKSKNKIYFFGEGVESWQIPTKEWGNYFYDSNILEGRDKYYWTLIKK